MDLSDVVGADAALAHLGVLIRRLPAVHGVARHSPGPE